MYDVNASVFTGASLVATASWLALAAGAAVPDGRLRRALLLLAGRAVPLALCAVYAAVLVLHWRSAPGGGFGSLAAVQLLFASSGKVLGAWVHFLAFDLLVGRWMVDDSLKQRRLRACLLLTLPATFLYGPAGLLLHAVGRLCFSAGARPSSTRQRLVTDLT